MVPQIHVVDRTMAAEGVELPLAYQYKLQAGCITNDLYHERMALEKVIQCCSPSACSR